tara:strand:- start:2802 stop:4181 length:1380 start_codon:yes stop_codon:yes gene_type:complete
MNLFNLEERNVKTVRILVYPNITFQEDLDKDSYIQVIKNQISLLNQIRDDLWFYLILPRHVTSLAFDNVTQWYVPLPTYPQTMRSHFDVFKMQKMLHKGLDFDLVMSHLPEHTHALENTMYNVTHHMPPVFGYCHWFDLKNVVTWSKDSFLQNVTGLLEMDRCYLNTQHQKDMVLNQARETFNDDTIDRLNNILEVQHLGVYREDIVSNINDKPDKVIVFNHRPDTYKHFNQFIAVTDKLWKMRQDFTVWVPLLDAGNHDTANRFREYVDVEKSDSTVSEKMNYYNQLKKCYMGFSPKQKYGGWSVATTDGMMNGVPYIMYDDTYYKELYPHGDFFENDHEALMLLNTYLDDPKYRNEEAQKALDYMSSSMVYKNEIINMSEYMDDLLNRQKVMSDTDKLKEIIEFIKKGAATKQQIMDYLGWGRGIKWSPYRRALMNHPNIFDVMDEYPMYIWRDMNG